MPTFTREALYERVWEQPVRTVAGELGLSDVGLKKACARADIPVPERGYWARLAAGKTVIKIALPPRGPGMPHEVKIGPDKPYRYPPDYEAELAEPEPVEPVFIEPLKDVEARVRARVGKVAPVRSFANTHPQIRKILDKDLALKTSAYNWEKPKFDAPFEQRRLKLLNTLCLAMLRVGMKVSVGGPAARQLGVQVGVQHVSFELDHPKARRDRWQQEIVHGGPIDTLRLSTTSSRENVPTQEWIDEGEIWLEDRLAEIVTGLVMAGEIQYRVATAWGYEHAIKHRQDMRDELVRRREEAARKERERLAELERKRRERLLSLARDLRDANDIRTLVAAVEVRTDASPERDAWMNWAHGVADRLDPLNGLSFFGEGDAR